MLIPSIDLMDGKIVQLVQGEKKALEFDNFDEWVTRFLSFPLVQLIDLDAAIGKYANTSPVKFFLRRLPCQIGGGIRAIPDAQRLLDLGARRVIFGSSLIQDGRIKLEFAKQACDELGAAKLVFAIDKTPLKSGKVDFCDKLDIACMGMNPDYPKGISPDLQSAVHWPRGNCFRIRQINRASSSVLAGPRAQTFFISSIQSSAEVEPALGPTHDGVNASCLSVPLLASVAEIKSPVFISLFCSGKTIPGIGNRA